jgi:hypothetical protein
MSSESVDHASTEPGHGHSPAAWTAVIIMLVAFTIGAVAFFYDLPIIVWAAAGLAIVGLIVGGVMKRVGYGVGGDKYIPKGH